MGFGLSGLREGVDVVEDVGWFGNLEGVSVERLSEYIISFMKGRKGERFGEAVPHLLEHVVLGFAVR
ncbi:MAG: hypothetical protein ACREN8_14150 [Candidatus Dormibacteraceae bacterium]